jgi:hypothetical protein
VNYREPRVALDKSEGVVKGKLLPSVFLAPLVSPEKVEDQGSGNLTLNHLRRVAHPFPQEVGVLCEQPRI